jgi:polyferredoxin
LPTNGARFTVVAEVITPVQYPPITPTGIDPPDETTTGDCGEFIHSCDSSMVSDLPFQIAICPILILVLIELLSNIILVMLPVNGFRAA